MTSKASRLAAFMATANTVALASAPSVETISTSFASLSNGAAFTGGISVANTISTGNAVVNGSLNVSQSATITGNAAVAGSLTVSGSATIAGNLVINGSTITVNTSQINVTDSLMYLATNNEASDSLDIGFAGHYNNGSGANGHTGLVRSATTKKFHLFQNYQPEFFANNVMDTSGLQHAPLVVGQLTANSINANGSVGTAGQALLSNGTIAYWGTVSAGATLISNTTDTQAFRLAMSNTTSGTWANAVVSSITYQPSTSTLSIGNTTVNTSLTSVGVKINNSYGSSGQVLKSNGSGTTWGSLSNYDVGLSNVPNIDATYASNMSGGMVPMSCLGSNWYNANSSNFLCGDATWKVPPSPSFATLSGLTIANTSSGDVLSYSSSTSLVNSSTWNQGSHWSYYGGGWYSGYPVMFFNAPNMEFVATMLGLANNQTFAAYDEYGQYLSIQMNGAAVYDTNGPYPVLSITTSTPASTWKNSLTITSVVVPQHYATVSAWGNANTTTPGIHISSLGVGTDAPNYQTNSGEIRAIGNIGAFYSSDETLKQNIRDVPDALEVVDAIGSKLFDWTDEYIANRGGADGYFVQKEDFGVIAQHVQKVFPIAVRTRPDGTLAVDYEKLGTLSFGAIGQLLRRIEALESKLQ